MGSYTTVRLDDELGERLQKLAEQSGLTTAAFARRLIESALERGQVESREVYMRLYGDAHSREVLTMLTRGWFPDGHPEVWRAYGRADGPWFPPSPGHGDARDALIANADVLATYRAERKKTPCEPADLAVSLASVSNLSKVVVEVTGAVDGATVVGSADRVVLYGRYIGFRLPEPRYEVSMSLPRMELGVVPFEGNAIPISAVMGSPVLRFVLALAAIGSAEWRANMSDRKSQFASMPAVEVRVATSEKRRRGRGSYTTYHRNAFDFPGLFDIGDAADEAVRGLMGAALPAFLLAARDAGRILNDEDILAESRLLGADLLVWMTEEGMYAPTALLDWVPCVWGGGVASSLLRITHYENHYSRPLVPAALAEAAKEFLRAELIRRAAVGHLLRRALEQ